MGQIVKKTLLGKELVFSESMDAFNSLRKKYLMLSAEAKEKAENDFDTYINSYSDYVRFCREFMNDIFEQYLQIGVLDIIRYGIYDIDEVVLKHEMETEYGLEYSNAIAEFSGKIYRIEEEEREAAAERKEAVRDARLVDGTLVASSGDVISDTANVIGSKISAGIMNGLAKGGTALVMAGVGALEKRAAENEKKELFENKKTRNDVVDGMERDVFVLHRTIARLINERTGIEHYYFAKDDVVERFEPICRNILRGNFMNGEDNALEIQQIHNVIMMNPYELRMYAYVMQKNNGITEELKELMDYLFVDKPSLASSYLETKYDLSEYKTYESIVDFEKVVMSELALFSIAGCAYSEKVAAKKERLYIERRTFHEFTYPTIEERDFAEQEYDAFVGDGLVDLDVENLLDKYDETYVQTLLLPNCLYIRKEILQLTESAVQEFKDSDSLSIYVFQAKKIKKERQLETLDVLDVIEKRYKFLVMKEKMEAKLADIKGKIVAFFKNFKGNMKRLWQKLMLKLPFGKKKVKIKKKKQMGIESVAVPEVAAAERQVTAAIPKAVAAKPEVAIAEPKVAAPEPVAVQEAAVMTEPVAVQEAVIATEHVAEPVAITPAVETKTCPQCGNGLKATAKFCSKCGYRF